MATVITLDPISLHLSDHAQSDPTARLVVLPIESLAHTTRLVTGTPVPTTRVVDHTFPLLFEEEKPCLAPPT